MSKKIAVNLVLEKLREGKNDQQVANEIGNISHDTIRRYRLRFQATGELEAKKKSIAIELKKLGRYYQDTGCEFYPKCLECPFERCVYDDPELYRRLKSIVSQ